MLTAQQAANLKAAILADSALSAFPNNSDGNNDLCRLKLNVLASPAFIVWNDALTPQQARAAILLGATQLDGLTQGKRDELFYIVSDVIDCRDPNVRAGLEDGAGSQNTLKNALIAAEKRNALLGEKLLLAAGTVGTTASPATLVYVGPLLPSDVEAARNS